MPDIPIIPQKKTNRRLSFSFKGEMFENEIATMVPIIKERRLNLSHFFILFPTKKIDTRISPKKKAQIYSG